MWDEENPPLVSRAHSERKDTPIDDTMVMKKEKIVKKNNKSHLLSKHSSSFSSSLCFLLFVFFLLIYSVNYFFFFSKSKEETREKKGENLHSETVGSDISGKISEGFGQNRAFKEGHGNPNYRGNKMSSNALGLGNQTSSFNISHTPSHLSSQPSSSLFRKWQRYFDSQPLKNVLIRGGLYPTETVEKKNQKMEEKVLIQGRRMSLSNQIEEDREIDDAKVRKIANRAIRRIKRRQIEEEENEESEMHKMRSSGDRDVFNIDKNRDQKKKKEELMTHES